LRAAAQSETLARMLDWLKDHPGLLWTLGSASVAMFIVSLIAIPAIIVRIRPDYFAQDERPPARFAHLTPTLRVLLHVLKNVLGVVLMLAGIAMLLLPGQGLLTLIIGFFLIDFPGKYRFEQWLIARPAIHRPLNWLRRRAGRVPLELHSDSR
jgi:hypothetical protein